MRAMFATLAMTTLLAVPSLEGAGTAAMSVDDQFAKGIDNVEMAPQEMSSTETITAEVVGIDGNRFVVETENGDQLVFVVDGPMNGLNVGDRLEMKLDDQAKAAEIINVLPREEQPAT